MVLNAIPPPAVLCNVRIEDVCFIAPMRRQKQLCKKIEFPYFFNKIFTKCTDFSVFSIENVKKFTENRANVYQKN